MMRFLSAFRGELRGRTALVRVDFNVENPREAWRVEAIVPTVKFLLGRGARIVLISHRGRPSQKSNTQHPTPNISNNLTLKIFVPVLERLLRQKVVFLPEIPKKLQAGKLFLLENLRLWPGEEKNDRRFARSLARLADFFVNDAFAVSHRRAASVVAITKSLPSYAGFCLEREIKTLGRVMRKPKKPLVLIIGGGKIKEKIDVIHHMLPKAARVLLGSAIRHKRAPRLPKSPKIIVPSDWLGEKEIALDIGPATIARYCAEIKKAATIIWGGPLGQFEVKRYRRGSEAIARAVAASRAFTVVGGGETTQLLREMRLEKKINFVSTGGGAMLEFLAGKRLPGLEALRNTK